MNKCMWLVEGNGYVSENALSQVCEIVKFSAREENWFSGVTCRFCVGVENSSVLFECWYISDRIEIF